jgi:phosphoglycerate dehydrogenase-like enzyme
LGETHDIVTGDEHGIISQLSDADILVSLLFTREMARAAPLLKLVQVPGAGLDRIDRAALRVGTRLANVHGHGAGIAEYVIGAILTLTRGFSRLDSKLRSGRWESQWAVGVPTPPPWPELAGKTLGVLGYGHIGQALARRARAFDMEVWALRRRVSEAPPHELAFLGDISCLDKMLERADHLVITVPLTDSTRGLLGEAQLRRMKTTAFLINPARAEIVDEEALYWALARKTIAGAALDVWYRYPTTSDATMPAHLPFHKLDNVLMTPHVSGWTEGMLEARSTLIADNIARTLRGELPLNMIETVA